MNENDFFKTSDLPLAGCLYFFGYIIESIDKNDPARVEFSFQRDNELDELVQRYWSKQVQVEPIGFFYSIKELKTRIYQS
jgi:hypothetical protein